VGAHAVAWTLHFSYGHRIAEHAGRCRHLHGHNARVEVLCRGELDGLGMVVDFGEIRRAMETWILANWDHRMILARDDPMTAVLKERGEPVFEMEGPPTAENLAEHLFRIAEEAGLPVVGVRLWETPTNMASFGEA
jgi:6-pyruvoyltetrahydropterin/6-carboxytetrahydropterin synthase